MKENAHIPRGFAYRLQLSSRLQSPHMRVLLFSTCASLGVGLGVRSVRTSCTPTSTSPSLPKSSSSSPIAPSSVFVFSQTALASAFGSGPRARRGAYSIAGSSANSGGTYTSGCTTACVVVGGTGGYGWAARVAVC